MESWGDINGGSEKNNAELEKRDEKEKKYGGGDPKSGWHGGLNRGGGAEGPPECAWSPGGGQGLSKGGGGLLALKQRSRGSRVWEHQTVDDNRKKSQGESDRKYESGKLGGEKKRVTSKSEMSRGVEKNPLGGTKKKKGGGGVLKRRGEGAVRRHGTKPVNTTNKFGRRLTNSGSKLYHPRGGRNGTGKKAPALAALSFSKNQGLAKNKKDRKGGG